MNLQQLRYICAVVRHGLNVSAAAESLHTSQPGVSKQVRLLEDELGVQIFERSGKQLTRVTRAGEAIVELAGRALIEIDTLKRAAQEFSDPKLGTLSIATTHTQARYVLPPVLARLAERYPRVDVSIHQGSPDQLADLTLDGTADCVIATEAFEHFENLVMLPCYRWRRGVLVPREHALAQQAPLTLAALVEYPLVTYNFGFNAGSPLDVAFRNARLQPRVALTATDADVIKTYVRAGFGVGIVAAMTHDPRVDTDLQMLDAAHLFESSTTKIGFRRGTFLRGFMYELLELFAPHLTRATVEQALSVQSRGARAAMFMDVELPLL